MVFWAANVGPAEVWTVTWLGDEMQDVVALCREGHDLPLHPHPVAPPPVTAAHIPEWFGHIFWVLGSEDVSSMLI